MLSAFLAMSAKSPNAFVWDRDNPPWLSASEPGLPFLSQGILCEIAPLHQLPTLVVVV